MAFLAQAKDGPVVELSSGVSYQGKSEHDGDSFRGIRYGQAPIGALRFAPPHMYAPSPDEGTIDATKLGQVCPQSSCTNTGCSEDCLFLNIFTGKNATAQAVNSGNLLPVAIFVHGGSYTSGSGNLYPGGPLVDFMDGQGIVVTLNYRLAALGFLGSEQLRVLDAKDGSTGNMGIQDQRMAFQWVQDHIASFGGDKSQVMIFGESAGAGSMTCHLTMKKSFGTYSRVVAESGAFAPWVMQPMSHAQASYESFVSTAGCALTDMACLQALTLDEIHSAYKAIPSVAGDTFTGDMFIFGPTVDGVEATTHAWIAASQKDGVNNVPVMFGTNRDEGSMFCDLNKDATLDELTAYWDSFGLSSDQQTQLAQIYLTDKTYPDKPADATNNWWAGQRALGDEAMSCPANYASKNIHVKQPVYQYFFDHVSKYADKHDGLVIHGSELPFVLHIENVFANIKDRKMSDIMASYWANFLLSKDGNPNESHAGGKMAKLLPNWPQYTEASPQILNIVNYDNCIPVTDLKATECEFWIPYIDQAMQTAF